MFIALHPSSGVPLYLQLLNQLKERIASGQVKSGEQLPSVRELSADLKINPLTVAKVYQILEREGLVETRRGMGTFVAQKVDTLPVAARRQALDPAVRQLVAEAIHLRLSEAEVVELIARHFQQIQPRNSSNQP